jgi:uncharacterized protein YceH (UPF0502 family)
MTIRPLSPHEARALGVLVEKALTVPDSYRCRSIRCPRLQPEDRARPVLNLGEGEVQQALDG